MGCSRCLGESCWKKPLGCALSSFFSTRVSLGQGEQRRGWVHLSGSNSVLQVTSACTQTTLLGAALI